MSMKEIVTKAIIGKSKKDYKNTYTVEVEKGPSTVLGCWIINHKFQAKEEGNKVRIDGNFDVNIWYSYDNDSKTIVNSKTINYTELEEVKLTTASDNTNKDIIIRVLKQPTCISAKEEGKTINLEVEKTLGIEIIGDAKVRIAEVEGEEEWDNVEEEEEIKVDPNYINTNVIK